eukprot:393956_1
MRCNQLFKRDMIIDTVEVESISCHVTKVVKKEIHIQVAKLPPIIRIRIVALLHRIPEEYEQEHEPKEEIKHQTKEDQAQQCADKHRQNSQIGTLARAKGIKPLKHHLRH